MFPQQTQLTPEQALQVLMQVTAHESLKMSRQEFGMVDQAIVTLQQAITPPPEPEPEAGAEGEDGEAPEPVAAEA